MQAAARNAAPNLTGMTVTPARSCKCAERLRGELHGQLQHGPMLGSTSEVTTSATAPNCFSYPGLSFTGAVSAKAVMRAR